MSRAGDTAKGRRMDPRAQPSRSRLFVEEYLRLVAAHTTHQIALRYGRLFPMWIGCGYPKSGTVWLCQLMSVYLGAPYPQNYLAPVAMRAVVHAHWKYDPRLARVAYIRRDGRDVMMSLYFYNMRRLTVGRDPRRRAQLAETYRRTFGAGFDPSDVRHNLPRFLELEVESNNSAKVKWQDHVRDWTGPDRKNICHVSYEELLRDPVESLTRLMGELTGESADSRLVSLALDRFDFSQTTNRDAGTEDRSSFFRKGVSGDWKNHFTREAGEFFDAHAGEALVEFGYADDRSWFCDLPKA